MSPLCPNGHSSAMADYCDQCGAPIDESPSGPSEPPGVAAAGSPAGGTATARSREEEEVDTSAAPVRDPCPRCGAARSGDDRYCERCGHDFLSTPVAVSWEAAVCADRGQFERFAVDGLRFPSDCLERRVALDGARMRIGRSRGRPGEQVPEIDLAGAPDDPGVSRLHAVLERQKDGTYTLRDLGSTNGTTMNDDPTPVGREHSVPLADGDLIRIGAWTTIRLRKQS